MIFNLLFLINNKKGVLLLHKLLHFDFFFTGGKYPYDHFCGFIGFTPNVLIYSFLNGPGERSFRQP